MPKRPWNQTNLPVYSLATKDKLGIPNFNICTYVTAISLKPKLFAVAVYKGTKTLQNLTDNPDFCNLQVLGLDSLNVFQILGKKTGKKINKQHAIEKKGIEISTFKNAPLIPTAISVMNLSKVSSKEYGDHVLFIFKVESYKTLNQKPILYTQDLIERSLIL